MPPVQVKGLSGNEELVIMAEAVRFLNQPLIIQLRRFKEKDPVTFAVGDKVGSAYNRRLNDEVGIWTLRPCLFQVFQAHGKVSGFWVNFLAIMVKRH